MKDKLPQATDVLINRLQRLAKKLDRLIKTDWAGTSDETAWRAHANTCWQAAARLEDLWRLEQVGRLARPPEDV